MRYFVFLISLFASSFSFGQAAFLPQVEVTGLQPYSKQFISVYFALGTPASIAVSPDHMNLREVRAKTTISIENQTSILTPKMSVVIQGFTVPFNVLLIVVHQNSKFTWKNANGTLPLGEDPDGSSRALIIKSFLKSDLGALTAADGIVRIIL
jgi:hypothetical protein